jgi:flagellar protein FliS
MQNRNGQYQRTQVETASPARLIVLLYDGAIRFCIQGIEAMSQGQLERQNTNLTNAQRIIAELMGSLKRDVGGEATENLFRIYLHMMEQLVYANLYDRKELVEAVLPMLYDLRETWVEVERITSTSSETTPTSLPTGANAAVTVAGSKETAPRIQRLGERSA